MVRNLLLENWSLFQEHHDAWRDLENALRPMLIDCKNECDNRGVELVFRWFWDGDVPNRNFAKAIRNLAWEFPQVKFWAYTRNFNVVSDLLGADNFILYLSVDDGNMINALATQQRYPGLTVEVFGYHWDGTQSLATNSDGERQGPR